MSELRCDHPGCGCMTSERYCSPHCEEHGDHATGDPGAHDCGCGHPECHAI